MNAGHAFLVVEYAIRARIARTVRPATKACGPWKIAVSPDVAGAAVLGSPPLGGALRSGGSGHVGQAGSSRLVIWSTWATACSPGWRQRRVAGVRQLLAVGEDVSRGTLQRLALGRVALGLYTMIHVGAVIGYAFVAGRVERVVGEVGVDRRTVDGGRRHRRASAATNLPALFLIEREAQPGRLGVGEVDVADGTGGVLDDLGHAGVAVPGLGVGRPVHGVDRGPSVHVSGAAAVRYLVKLLVVPEPSARWATVIGRGRSASGLSP